MPESVLRLAESPSVRKVLTAPAAINKERLTCGALCPLRQEGLRMADDLIRSENPAPGVARVVMARADKHNSRNPELIFAIDAAFARALADDTVKVVILAADGQRAKEKRRMTA